MLPDSDLADQIRVGDHDAFRKFYDAHQEELSRFLARQNVDTSIRKDIIQIAFISLWEGRSSIDSTKSLRALLYRIARTRLLNHFRDRAKMASIADESHLMAEDDSTASDEDDGQSLRVCLDAAIGQLPERRRAVFELCYVNGLTYREAAEALGVSVKTVENQMGHALKFLRRALKTHL